MAEILFQNKVSSSVANKTVSLSDKLGTDANWWQFVQFNESSFDPHIENQIGCVGLLQFCSDPGTLGFKKIGDKTYRLSDIQNMSSLQQLDLIYEYFKPYRSQLNSYQAMSLATLTPGYLDEIDNDNFVFPNWVTNANPSLFKHGNTMRDYKRGLQDRVYEIVPTRFYDSFFEKKKDFSKVRRPQNGIFFGFTGERYSLRPQSSFC